MSETGGGARSTAASVEEDPNATVVCNSPPCFMHELDPSYLGYLRQEEVSALLGALLAAEWGGAAPDEARLRAVLRRHLEALRASPDRASCASHDGAAASGGPDAAAGSDDRTPPRLARTIREALPRLHDEALRRDLGEVLGALEQGSPHRGKG